MKYYGITDKGLVRETNQDNYVTASNSVGDVFAVVCDGIGGGQGGDIASKLAIDFFSEAFSENDGFSDAEDLKRWVRQKIGQVNDLIFSKSTESHNLKGMGTTLVGLLITKVGRFVVNMGDSRVYCVLKDGQFVQVTQDHTLVQELLRTGEISEEEALFHPKKNVLTNALGVWDQSRVDIEQYDQPAEAFLICSDGLYGYTDHERIQEVMLDKGLTTGRKVQKLLKLALDAGGYDNITMILIELEASDK